METKVHTKILRLIGEMAKENQISSDGKNSLKQMLMEEDQKIKDIMGKCESLSDESIKIELKRLLKDFKKDMLNTLAVGKKDLETPIDESSPLGQALLKRKRQQTKETNNPFSLQFAK